MPRRGRNGVLEPNPAAKVPDSGPEIAADLTGILPGAVSPTGPVSGSPTTEGVTPVSSTRSAVRVFDFAVRPHSNAADAVAYFDTLVRLTVRRELTPAEWREYGRARAAYVRCSLGMARNMPD